MKIVTPLPIDDSTLVSSTHNENDTDDALLWTTGAKTVGQRVRRAETHRVYECLVAHTATVSDTPETLVEGKVAVPKWVVVRPTNLWAAFDTVMSTQSTGGTSDTISWTFAMTQRFDTVTVFEADCAAVRVKVTVDGAVKYDETKNTRLRNRCTWSDWFYKPISVRRDISFQKIPSYRNAYVEITVVRPGSVPRVGDIQIGRVDPLGDLLWKPSIRTVDYSIVKTDQFGNTVFVPRRAVRVVECDVDVESANVDEVVRLLTLAKSSVRAFLGSEDYSVLNSIGFVQDFRVVLSGPEGASLNIQIQGLT